MHPGSPEEQELKAEHGQALMQDYMEILAEDDAWKRECFCMKCGKECATPFGISVEEACSGRATNIVDWYIAGTVCVDVSMMGNRMALLGDSSRSLAIFLAMIKKCRPHGVTHECTSFFSQFLFDTYLPEYKVHRFAVPENREQRSCLRAGFQSDTWLLSPHQFGWPCFRPR